MARYSQRTGPAANFELTTSFQTIPGFTISRYFDQGELLIIACVDYRNNTAAVVSGQIRILVDGMQPQGAFMANDTGASQDRAFSVNVIVPINEGIHTIELQALGAAAANDFITADRAVLSVIQLPHWDQQTDLVDN